MQRRTVKETIDLGISRQLIEITDTTIKYLIQNKEYNLEPEERVRAVVYVELVEDYHYSPLRIDFEIPVPRRTPSDFADIVVYEDDQRLINYIVVETKRPDCSDTEFNQAVEQGFGNANSLRSKYVIVDSFKQRQVYNVGSYPPNERVGNKIADISINYGLAPTYRLSRGGRYDLRTVSFNELASVFQKCHNILWSGGKLDPATAFDEMSKIIFSKIHDERTTPNRQPYRFQVGQYENEVIVAQRSIELYNDARRIDPYVFTESIHVSYSKIKSVVEVLQEISLTNTDLDTKGQAFEKFLGVVFRGGLGQYFTRRQIVEFVVEMLDPDEKDVVLDPSCGSGGFLLYCMKKVIDKIKANYAGNTRLIDRKIYDFTRQKVYGIEINAKIARVAMMDMIVNDDGHTNIENNTGFNSNFKNPNIVSGKFTLIMTNPPFGVKIERGDRDNLGQNDFNNFVFGRSRKSQLSDILFLEQYKRFLVDEDRCNPRAGVVLQTGVLNNPSNKKLLRWLRLNFRILAVVSLPAFAFRKAGSGMKTCLLFIRKYHSPYTRIEDIPNYDVFFAVANHIGYDSTLRPDSSDFCPITTHYKNHTEDRPNGVFWIPFSELDYRLDPRYYFNKFVISQHFKRLKERGHRLVPLCRLLLKMNAGKSPEGGVTRSTGEIPSITITNITKDGTLDFSSTLNFVPDIFYKEFNRIKGGLEYLDILIAKDGATTGKTAIIGDSFPFLEKSQNPPVPKAIFSEHIFRLRMKPGVNPWYIHAFLNSELGQLQLETVISGGAQGGITRDFITEIYIPVVDETTQQSIADYWTNGMKETDNLRKQYDENINETKKEVDRIIENAEPLSYKQLQKILDLKEEIEKESD